MAIFWRGPVAWAKRLKNIGLSCLNKDPNPLVCMVHNGRSGSTVLADMLSQRNDVFWEGEIWCSFSWGGSRKGYRRPATAFHKHFPVFYAWWHSRVAPGKTYGMEIKLWHAQHVPGGITALLDRIAVIGFGKFVFLRRRNYLRMLASSLLAAKKKQFHRYEEDGQLARQPSEKITISTSSIRFGHERIPLRNLFQRYDEIWDQLEKDIGRDRRLDLYYEEHVEKDPSVGYGMICRFLNLPELPAKVRLSRTTPYPLADLVENLEEVRACLASTPYAWMAEEEVVNS